MLLSIIIVSYEVKYFLEQCLFSVTRAVQHLESVRSDGKVEVIVVDNASADGTVEYLENRFPSVRFIANKENMGFGRANNLGLMRVTGKYTLFLNPDTILPEKIFDHCVSFFESHESVGSVGVRMIDGQGKFLIESKRGFPTVWRSFCKLSGLSSLFPHSKRFAAYNAGHLNEEGVFPVDALAGAFLAIRKKVVDDIGGFDERFFMYAEDIDLSKRVKDAGFENYYLGNETILHFKGESTKKDVRYVKIFYEAMNLYVQKHYSGAGSRFSVALMKTAIGIRSLISRMMMAKGREEWQQPLTAHFIGDENEIILLKKNLVGLKEDPASGTIIICEGNGYSFERLIEDIQTAPGEKKVLIHTTGSLSIVGSGDKNTQGVAIPIA